MQITRSLLEGLAGGRWQWRDLERMTGLLRSEIADRLTVLGVFARADAALSEDPPLPDPPLDFLNPEAMAEFLPQAVDQAVDMEVLWTVDSTNTRVMDRLQSTGSQHPLACACEYQTSGRGRKGRQWLSPPARNVMLSVGCGLPTAALRKSGMSLAVGVEICRTLKQLGCSGRGREPGLKWPNDLLLRNGKFGGILIESRMMARESQIVVGVGINLFVPASVQEGIDQQVTDLYSAGLMPDRNRLVATLAARLSGLLLSWEKKGFAAWKEAFDALHLWHGKSVRVADTEVVGVVKGTGGGGELLLQKSDGQTLSLNAGEISLRAVSGEQENP